VYLLILFNGSKPFSKKSIFVINKLKYFGFLGIFNDCKSKFFIRKNHLNSIIMKTRWIILPALALLIPVLAQAQSSSYEDDLYYNPNKVEVEAPQKESSKVREESMQDESVRVHDNTGTLRRNDIRNVDEYNRRAPLDSEAVAENVPDSVDENGQPFEYAERVRRFHDPKFTTHITDNEYLDIYIEDGADVDVYYVDNNSNGWMSPFYFDNFYYPRYGYRWNNYNMYYNPWGYSSWGYYDPWYAGSYGWDYGFYGGYYGYGYPGYYGYGGYNYGGGHHHGDMGEGGHSRNNRLNSDQRRFLSNNGSGRTTTTRNGISSRATSPSRSSYGTSARANSSTSTRSGSGTTTRSNAGTTTRSSTGTTTRSTTGTTTRSSTGTTTRSTTGTTTRSSTSTTTRATTTTAPEATTVTRTSRSGSSSSETRSSTPTESTTRSTYTPSSSSSSSSRSSYTPSSSSSNSSSSGSSSSSRSSGGSSSSGRR